MGTHGLRKIFGGLVAVAAIGAAGLTGAVSASASGASTQAVVYQQIVNLHSGKCVDVRAASQANGAVVQQFTCTGNSAQAWTKIFTDSGYFQLKVAHSNKCLTVPNSSQVDGAGIVQSTCTGAFNQQWIQQSSGVSGWPFLVARHSGKGLCVASESLLNEAPLCQYETGADGSDDLHGSDWQFQ